MQNPQLRAGTCKHTLSSWYIRTHAATLSALNVCRHMRKHVWLSIRASTHSYTLSSWYVWTHAHTRSALDTSERIKTHIQPVICGDTCTHTPNPAYRPRHAQPSTRAAWDRWRYVLTLRYTPPNADTRSALDARWNMQAHSAQDPSHRIQKQAQLFRRAGTYRHPLSSFGHRELNEDARSPLETSRKHAHGSLGSLGHRELNEDAHSPLKTCQQTLTSRYMQTTHTHLSETQGTEWRCTVSSRNMPTNSHLSRHMQNTQWHAALDRADTH